MERKNRTFNLCFLASIARVGLRGRLLRPTPKLISRHPSPIKIQDGPMPVGELVGDIVFSIGYWGWGRREGSEPFPLPFRCLLRVVCVYVVFVIFLLVKGREGRSVHCGGGICLTAVKVSQDGDEVVHFALWVCVLARSVGLSQMGLDMMRGGRMADLLFLNGRGGGFLIVGFAGISRIVCSFVRSASLSHLGGRGPAMRRRKGQWKLEGKDGRKKERKYGREKGMIPDNSCGEFPFGTRKEIAKSLF